MNRISPAFARRWPACASGWACVSPEEVAAAVLTFVRDDALAGRVMVLRGGEPARRLDPIEG